MLRTCLLVVCIAVAGTVLAAEEDRLPEAGRAAVKEAFPNLTYIRVKELRTDPKQFYITLTDPAAADKPLKATVTMSLEGKIINAVAFITPEELPQVVKDGVKASAPGAEIVSASRTGLPAPKATEGPKPAIFYDVVLKKDETTGKARFREDGALKGSIQWQEAPAPEKK